MTPEQITDIVRQALFVALQVSAPLLLLAMAIGFSISLFQSVTQINEMTLTFVPKILVFALALGIFFPWILKTLTRYTLTVLQFHWDSIITATNYAQ
jgi:flagellar biosynthetic protein FliQ